MPRTHVATLPLLILRSCRRCGGALARNPLGNRPEEFTHSCIHCGEGYDYPVRP